MRQTFSYDEKTGALTWLSGARQGKEVCRKNAMGYLTVTLNGVIHLAHRLAWLHVHGSVPRCIDHINGDKDDNRLANLRAVTHRLNMQNQRKAQKNNTLGVLGVSKNWKRFRAHIWAEGRERHLGTFDTVEEAHAAYVRAKRVLHEGATL